MEISERRSRFLRGVVIEKDMVDFIFGKKLNKESNLYMTLPALANV